MSVCACVSAGSLIKRKHARTLRAQFAYHCGKVLLDERSAAWLCAADFRAPNFRACFDEYAAWLSSGGGVAPVWAEEERPMDFDT